jgi:ribonuclease BN (tRNA processing enzyme)
MRIKILGTRGEIQATHPMHLLHSGILIDQALLFDVGERYFLKYNPLYIFITHLHPDHAFFMSPGTEIKTDATIFAPERSERLKSMHVISRALHIAEYRVTPIPVIHSIKVKSLGYLIEKNNKRIFYSGDIISIKEQYFKKLRKVDLVITEASFLRKGGLVRKSNQNEIFGHAGVPDLVNLFEKFTKRIVFTHFGSWFLKDISSGIQKIKEMERKDLKIDIASDGSEYII